MLIILEGCDGTFKSTIAEKLSKELKVPVKQGSSFELAKKTLPEYFQWCIDTFDIKEDVIFDRGIYSNRVYADLYSKDYELALLTPSQVDVLESLMKLNHEDVLVIYLYAFEEDIVERINSRGDKYIKPERVRSILGKYSEVMGQCNLPFVRFNTSMQESDNIVDFVLELLRRK